MSYPVLFFIAFVCGIPTRCTNSRVSHEAKGYRLTAVVFAPPPVSQVGEEKRLIYVMWYVKLMGW